jgi:hypothetical protein
MAGTDKSKQEESQIGKVDPSVEAKVDAMMTGRPVGPKTENKNLVTGDSKSAPLLPGEKLPDFDKLAGDKANKPQLKPKRENEMQDNNLPAKESKPKSPIEDPATDKAVEEIVEEESDRMLAIEDAKAQLLAEGSAEIDRGFFNRLKSGIGRLLKSPKAWVIFFVITLLAAGIIAAIPSARYFVLNFFGVRASASFRVVDDKTLQPLKNAEVTIDDKSGKSDKSGNVRLEGIKLGPKQLTIKKPAFADVAQEITIGWGSNPIGDFGLTAVGSRYVFDVKDFVSGKPIKGAEATSGEASATADEKGRIVLVVAEQGESKVNIEIKADNYRDEKTSLEVGDKEIRRINLVPSKKHAFVSKRSGKYDLYRINVDGKNEEVVLAGTGTESEETTAILPSLNSNLVAYVSTRGEQRNKDGFALSSLAIVNLDDKRIDEVDASERIQLVEFIGNKLIYVEITEGEGDTSPERHRIISYDIATREQKELAKANYFNVVLAAKGSIYYAPAIYKAEGNVGLFKINPDGSGKATITDKETWNLFRVSYDKIDAAVGQNWYEYDTVAGTFNAMNGAPPVQKSGIYADNSTGAKSAWIDDRDGKGVLIIYDTKTGKDKVLQTQSGLNSPLSWLDNDHLVYRVANSSETADYVISLSGGEPKKIRDVTNTAGVDRWYYY